MYDCLIIGAGPAGLSASITCRKWGLSVLVIDEFPKPGGRLLGQLHLEPNGKWWNGIEESEKLLKQANDFQVDIRCGISAHNLDKTDEHFIVYTDKGVFEAKNILIATGAQETPVIIPGWMLPGVMSIGAAQVMTNVHRVRVGKKGLIIGINVLSVAIARELQLAGIDVECIVLPPTNPVNEHDANPKNIMESLSRVAHLAPSSTIRFGSRFLQSSKMRNLAVKFFPTDGVKMWGMPIHLRKAATKINGVEEVKSVTICNINENGEIMKGTEKTIEVDFVCVAGNLSPLAELAAVIGCPFQYVEELGGHVPVHNERMETPIPGLFVAGNITGIESSKVAMAQGTLAGLSIVKAMGDVQATLEKEIEEAVDVVRKTRENALIQFHPNINQGRKKMEEIYERIVNE